MEALVSIIIPVYNVEAYLDRCLRSIVGQTYENIEIIIVDDGSTDNSGSLCDDWAEADCRIRVIHKVNEGLGMARNTGLANANGEFIYFVDSDDYVDLRLIEKCLSCIIETDADVVLFGRSDVYPDGKVKVSPVKCGYCTVSGDEVKKRLLPGLFLSKGGLGVSAWSKFFRVSSLRSNNIVFKSEREIISEDAYFSLQYFTVVKKAVILPESLYFYFRNDGSLSRKYKEDRQTQNDVFLQKCLSLVQDAGIYDSVHREIKIRYQGYTVTALKHIYAFGFKSCEKRKKVLEILKDPVLHGTLSNDVLELQAPALKLFFSMLKYKCYLVCRFFLWLLMKR